MSTIVPTVGRKVWFYGYGNQPYPIDATIIHTWGDQPNSAVNLSVCHPFSGEHTCETSISVGDEKTPGRHYRWMPFQQGQAKAAAAAPATPGVPA